MIIRFVGFGGQGIILSSYIMGQSAVLDGKKALQNQSYGSESRGGECRGDVIISDEDIYELEPSEQDVLVAMTQPGYEKFIDSLRPGGTLLLDSDLVTESVSHPPEIKKCGINATDIAFRQFGRSIVANMVMLGFMNAHLNLVTVKSLEKAITNSVPPGTEELNVKAMRQGMKLAASRAI